LVIEKQIPWWRTEIGEDEIQKIAISIGAEHISQGPITEQFEQQISEILNIPYVVATTSGSSALLMSLMAIGVKPGDEVIVPNWTFIATAHAARMAGAKVVLVDSRPDVPLLDVDLVRAKITPRTKVIMPVHLNGRSVDMVALKEVADEHGISLVEDAAQAFYSKNATGFLGTQSDVGCFSFGMTKLVATGQGGVVVTKRKDLYEHLLKIRNHGIADSGPRNYSQLSFNFKFNDILSSIGIVQLSRLPGRIEHLKKIYHLYSKIIEDVPYLDMIATDLNGGEIPLWAEVLCEDRDKLINYLSDCGVNIYKPMYNLHHAVHLGNSGPFVNSQKFDEQILFLPCGPEQPLENIDRVEGILKDYIG
jgi:perosamine synthetase